MTEMSGLDREVTPQGKVTSVSPWYGVYRCTEIQSWRLTHSLNNFARKVPDRKLGFLIGIIFKRQVNYYKFERPIHK